MTVDLLLLPTEMELEGLLGPWLKSRQAFLEPAERGAPAWARPRTLKWRDLECAVAITGVGIAAAAASSSLWFSLTRCKRALLAGVVGTYRSDELAPGSALVASEVHCLGIGALNGEDVEPLPFADLSAEIAGKEVRGPILCDHSWIADPKSARPLLTVCAASGSRSDASRRSRLFPQAAAEDMESYGVALAATLHDFRLAVVRGISNVAGDRDHSRWCLEKALESCLPSVERWLSWSGR